MSSGRSCKNCKEETRYLCLICEGPVCNREDWAVFLSEEIPNWKDGSRVSACLPCNTNRKLTNVEKTKEEEEISPKATKVPRTTTHKPAKRNYLSLKQRVELINYAKDHPSQGYRKAAKHFGIGRTQAYKILKEKDSIVAQYESNQSSSSQKRERTGIYQNVNEALWNWYCLSQ